MSGEKRKMSDAELSRALEKNSGGRMTGKMLAALGLVIAVGGILLGNFVVMIFGGVVLALGQMLQGKARDQVNQRTFEEVAPDIMGTVFQDIDQNPPDPKLLYPGDTNIPVPTNDYSHSSGYIRGTYQGKTIELCTVKLVDSEEIQREETGLWEKNEREVYRGQWMLCEFGQTFPTWITIWPRGALDKVFSGRGIKTGNAAFDKRFNLASGDETTALLILSPARMERILAVSEATGGKLALNLNTDGKLYIAVHSGHGFFDIMKGKESPTELRARFAREIRWFTDTIDAFLIS